MPTAVPDFVSPPNVAALEARLQEQERLFEEVIKD